MKRDLPRRSRPRHQRYNGHRNAPEPIGASPDLIAISLTAAAISPMKIVLAKADSDMPNIGLNRVHHLVDVAGKDQFSHGQPETDDLLGCDMRWQ
jgi:hypothetical protein